jgi:hypothetical protein
MIELRDETLIVETKTLYAKLERGCLTTLRAGREGPSLLGPVDPIARPALQIVYSTGEVAHVDAHRHLQISTRLLSSRCAEVRFHGWDMDGVLLISECLETGDMLIEPSAYSSRPGVMACRWNLAGIPAETRLVAPFYQGISLPLDDPLIQSSRWRWPMFWEAGLAILQNAMGGFWVHTQDTRYRYKALQVGLPGSTQGLGFETEAYGPLDSNLAAGGLAWRLNVFSGDWKTPASQYRNWFRSAYGLDQRILARKAWVQDIRLAVSWCPTDPDILDALAERIAPGKVLIHLPNWRTDAYDENYPDFVPSSAGSDFVGKARAMGFRVMPHCNSVDMDPSHPVYAYIRDFQYRDVQSKSLHGWAWEEGSVLGVPSSNASLVENRPRKVMVKVHPGLAMWRSILSERIQKALHNLELDSVFVDVTLCSGNLHNCLVEHQTSSEGMKRLIDYLAGMDDGVVVGGEGLNEITAQGLSFAQAHLFQSHQTTHEGLERAAGCPLNAFLFEKLARTFGYSGLSGRTEQEQLRSRVHLSLGAIPTFTGLTPGEIRSPSPAIQELFEAAAG